MKEIQLKDKYGTQLYASTIKEKLWENIEKIMYFYNKTFKKFKIKLINKDP